MGVRSGKALSILLLTDLSIPLQPEQFDEYLKTDDWKSDANVIRTLRRLGHEVRIFGIHDDIRPLIAEVERDRPDVVFNLCEAFGNDRDFEPHVAALLELLRVPYTGAGVTPLRVCKDKSLTKKILSYHRVRVPRFVVSRKSKPLRSLGKFPFPAFIKPLALEASEGIAQVSFAEDEKHAIERVRYINEKLAVDAIVEEYIDGRELYVGVMGNERLVAFPPRELFFRQVPEGEPKIATFRAKWDDGYRRKWGIDTGPAKGIAPEMERRIAELCKKIYRLLQMSGYGRIDLRLTPEGEIVFIEANPNPSIAREDDFAQSAEKAGIDYDELIARILRLVNAG
ncbi:MAG: ATP-grasp domain-containing protein [Oligoflexia bacterium]|nr:ATP-grasp domain-containing protein [Oligoflexia bacterium]